MRRAFLSLAVLIALTALAVASPQYGAQQGAAQNVRFTGGSVQNVTDTTATLTWNTNVQSSAIVKYGTDRNNLSQTAEAPWGGPNHTVTISGLQPNTTYFFQVTSGQAEGTGSQAVSEIYQFRTKPSMGARGGVFGQTTQAQTSAASSQSGSQAQITNGPVVEGTTPTTAVIAWTTNVNSGTTIKYGTDPNSLSQTAEMPWGGITHRVHLKNLQPGTTYYFQAMSPQAQGSGISAQSQVGTFTTAQNSASSQAPTPNQGTASDNIKLAAGPVPQDLTDKSARIWWATDKPAETIVKYGTDLSTLQTAPEKPWGQTQHSVDISNLSPDTAYQFRIENAKGEVRASGQFKTLPAAQTQANAVRITNGPVIEHIDQNAAIIAWSTNAKSSTVVHYGTDSNSLNQVAEAGWGEGGVNSAHRVHLNNLQPNTTYYFEVESTQAQGTGTQTRADVGQFTTPAPGQAAFNNPQPH